PRGRCLAVGSVTNAVGSTVPAALDRRGGGWSTEDIPAPGGRAFAQLHGVSCPSRLSCTAVGSCRDSAGNLHPLVERWNGARWTIQLAPSPARTTNSELYDVTCSSARSCVAVGDSWNRTYTYSTLSERWDGRRWRIEPMPPLPGSSGYFRAT